MVTQGVLNALICREVERYQAIRVRSAEFAAPYFTNELWLTLFGLLRRYGADPAVIEHLKQYSKGKRSIYGAGRGKSTPEEIGRVCQFLLTRLHIDERRADAAFLLDLLKFHGVGVDCSGFVFNVLIGAYSEIGMRRQFLESLDWGDASPSRYHASCRIFAGRASELVERVDIQPLDVILIRGSRGYVHIALIVEQSGLLKVAQSSLTTTPTGVSLLPLSMAGGEPGLDHHNTVGTSWNDLLDRQLLEFRRLLIG